MIVTGESVVSSLQKSLASYIYVLQNWYLVTINPSMMNGRFYMMYLAKVYFNLLGYLT